MGDMMTDRFVLDFDRPLAPDDIEVGNVIVLHGEPRTIREVRPLAALPARLPALVPQLVADVGHGESQAFYVLTCGACHTMRAFPGLRGTEEWFGLAHGNGYRVFCSTECLMNGVLA